MVLVSADFDESLPQARFPADHGVDFPPITRPVTTWCSSTRSTSLWTGALPATFLRRGGAQAPASGRASRAETFLRAVREALQKGRMTDSTEVKTSTNEGGRPSPRRSLGAPGVVLIAGMAAAQGAGSAPGARDRRPAPLADTRMKNVDGKETSIAQVKGAKGTLVVFTCNHCPWAKAWHSRIVSLGNKSVKRGVGVIAINSNDPDAYSEDAYPAMQSNAKKTKMGFPYVVDATSDVARAFGATRTPEAFLFDAGGHLVYHGAIDDNAKQPDQVKVRYLEDAVNALVDGKEIALAETKFLGCGIKYRAKT